MLVSFLSQMLVVSLGLVLVAMVSSKLVWAFERRSAHRPNLVRLKLGIGRVVMLDLDRRLPAEKRGELVTAAVRSAEAGDEVRLKQVVDDSHAASVSARGA